MESGTLKVYTAKDLQLLFGIGKDRAYQLLHSKYFPVITINNRMFVTEDSLKKWLQSLEGKTIYF